MAGWLGVLPGWADTADVLGWWTFGDGDAGTAVTTVQNRAAEDSYAGQVNTDGAASLPLLFSDEIPGAYVYAKSGDSTPAFALTNSVYFRKANPTVTASASQSLVFPELAHALTECDDFTVEFFYKNDTSSGYSGWNTLLSMTTAQKWKIGYYDKSSQLTVENVTYNVRVNGVETRAVTNGWHHVAVVHSAADHNLKLYWDYGTHGKSVALTNAPGSTVSAPVCLGTSSSSSTWNTEGFNGWIAVPRVTARALAPDEFMVVGPNSATLAFYPFNDGAPGAVAAETDNAASALFKGEARPHQNLQPLYSADTPGAYLFEGLTAAAPVAGTYQSVYFQTVNPASLSAGCAMNLLGLNTALALNSQGYTVEFFYKHDVSRGRCDYKTFLRGTTSGVSNGTWKFSENGWNNMYFQNTAIGSGSSGDTQAKVINSDMTNGWHHAAAVFDVPGKTVRWYWDYASVSGALEFTNKFLTTSVPLTLASNFGNSNAEGFDGWIAGVRVSRAMLTPRQFLRAVNRPDVTTVCLVNFEEGADGAAVAAAASTHTGVTRTVTTAGWEAIPEAGGAKPVFAANAWPRGARVFAGTEYLHDTSAAAAFTGATAQTVPFTNGKWAASGFTVRAADMTPFLAEEGFTCEAYVKLGALPVVTDPSGVLVMGLGLGTDSRYIWRLALNVMGRWDDLTAYTADGDAAAAAETVALGPCALTDRKWHHLAVTWTPAEQTIRVYVDHALLKAQRLERPLALDKTDRWRGGGFLFGRGCDRGGFTGLIDEIRVSRGALSPDDFLRVEAPTGTVLLFR